MIYKWATYCSNGCTLTEKSNEWYCTTHYFSVLEYIHLNNK